MLETELTWMGITGRDPHVMCNWNQAIPNLIRLSAQGRWGNRTHQDEATSVEDWVPVVADPKLRAKSSLPSLYATDLPPPHATKKTEIPKSTRRREE
jgi:hypothetical protein